LERAQSDELVAELEALHPAPHPLLVELEQHARKDGVPAISRATGRFLSTIVTAMQASRILEVGTAYGYATLWMALAQPSLGKIWTIDPDVHRTDVARSYFHRAAEDDYIEVFNTPALELLENFPHRNLDLIFVAANEREYPRYLEVGIPMLKLSGLAIFNDCAAMADFANRFLTHPALDATILPFGIGIGARRR
jgi:caffeoyl-CoA O-methyltransferase